MLAGNFSIQRLAYYLICLCIVLGLLYIGSSFFVPMVYGLFLAFMLKPICDWIEKYTKRRVISILLSMLAVVALLAGIFYLFASQILEVIDRADNVMANLEDSWSEVTEWFGELIGMDRYETNKMVEENINVVVEQPLDILTIGLTTSGKIFANVSLMAIYCFFFLLYSTAFKRFVLSQFSRGGQDNGMQVMRNIQAVATNYLSGIVTVMLILAVLNTIGLYAIGIQFALIWGFLAAMLAIIPYVGTALGGLLPFIYAIATTDTVWQPIAVIVLYTVVQFIEGNFITPKVVGNSVKINALAAVISIIFGALLWGIAGVVIAIPLLAMTRIILDQIGPFRSVALLLSDSLYDESERFVTEFSTPEYRLSQIFTRRPLVGHANQVNLVSVQPGDEVSQANPEIVADPKS